MHCNQGVTLVELTMVLAVVAILAAASYPSFQEHVRASRRTEVQVLMMEMSVKQHQRLFDVRRYAAGSPADLGVWPPAGLERFYSVTATADNEAVPPTFTIIAMPVLQQSDDRCGTLAVDQNGQRTALLGSLQVTGCW